MKILIDSDETRTSNTGNFYRIPIMDQTGFWLPVKVKQQLKSRWCWAALANAFSLYYDENDMDQHDLADKLLANFKNAKGLYSEIDIRERNVNFKLDEALRLVNCFSHWTIGKPTFERIQYEINQGRPFAVRLEWFRGGAHYVLIKGYHPIERTILVEDSLYGSSAHSFSTFPDNYQESGAVWTETFWTNKLTIKS